MTSALRLPTARPSRTKFLTPAKAGLAVALALAAFASTGSAIAKGVADQFSRHAAGSSATIDHGAWDRLLKTYVVPGSDGLNRITYAKFKAGGADALKTYLAMLQRVDVASLDKSEQFAYWSNLYNAKTIDIVLDKYPVSSIKKIKLGGSFFATFTGGPWKAKVMKVGGVKLSLDDVEHGILRPLFKDPRVHYAVNCASVGCPNLGTQAFTGAKLDEQLNQAAAAYINSPRGFSVQGGRITASSIYKWFVKDFGGNATGVIAHASRYAAPELKAKLNAVGKISNYGYDWGLNDAK